MKTHLTQRLSRWLIRRLRSHATSKLDPAKLSELVTDTARAQYAVKAMTKRPDWRSVEREQLAAYAVMCPGLQRRPPKVEALV